MKQPFQYATIELRPYPALGEFVIVGVLAVGAGRSLRFRLLKPAKTTRLTQFFPEIERRVFTETLQRLREEFAMLAEQINGQHDPGFTLPLELPGSDARGIFRVLTSPKEGMVQIQSRGAGMTEDLDQWVEDSFDRFVLRTDKSAPDPAEQVLTNRIKRSLKAWKMDKVYQEVQLGESHYHATFPFAYTPEGAERPGRVVKPLHLAQDTPTKIFEHGDQWLQKIRRLDQYGHRPDRVIFPVQLPQGTGFQSEERQEVAAVLLEDFRKQAIEIVQADDAAALRKSVIVDPMPVGGLFA